MASEDKSFDPVTCKTCGNEIKCALGRGRRPELVNGFYHTRWWDDSAGEFKPCGAYVCNACRDKFNREHPSACVMWCPACVSKGLCSAISKKLQTRDEATLWKIWNLLPEETE